jgi:hypothetical protein
MKNVCLNASPAAGADRLRGAKTWSGVWQVTADCLLNRQHPADNVVIYSYLGFARVCPRLALQVWLSKVET